MDQKTARLMARALNNAGEFVIADNEGGWSPAARLLSWGVRPANGAHVYTARADFPAAWDLLLDRDGNPAVMTDRDDLAAGDVILWRGDLGPGTATRTYLCRVLDGDIRAWRNVGVPEYIAEVEIFDATDLERVPEPFKYSIHLNGGRVPVVPDPGRTAL